MFVSKPRDTAARMRRLRPSLGAALLAPSLVGLAGCATVPDAQSAANTEATVETAALDPALAPASEDARAAAERAPALERANFWSAEHAKDPSDPLVSLRFAEALRAIGSHDRIVEVTTQTLVVHPADSALHLAKGRAHMALGQPELAVNAFTRASSNDPMSDDAYAALGHALDQVGQHRRAQTAYRRALTINEDRATTRSNLGLSLMLSGDLDAAEAELRAASASADAPSTVAQNLALVLGLKGDYDAMAEAATGAPDDVVDRNVEVMKAFRDGRVDTASVSDTGEALVGDMPPTTERAPSVGLRGALPDAS